MLVLTALSVALLTWLTWKASNGVQDAIRADADARIGEAKKKAAEANEIAGRANERAGTLESSNLVLRGQVATLETDAANAKAEQQRVQMALAKQQERAAIAETQADKLRIDLTNEVESTSPRSLSELQREILVKRLKGKIKAITFIVPRDQEAEGYFLRWAAVFSSEIGSIVHEERMRPGESFPINGNRVLMYKPATPGSASLSGDVLYEALAEADLFGGSSGSPFITWPETTEEVMHPNNFSADEYGIYIGQKRR